MIKKNYYLNFVMNLKNVQIQERYIKQLILVRGLNNKKSNIINKTSNMYIILSENEYVKDNLDLYLINKDKNKDKEKLDPEQSKDLLFEFCNEFKKCPISRETYKTINIGSWLNEQKRIILNKTSNMYIKLSENEYVKDNLDLYLINKDKEKLDFEQIQNSNNVIYIKNFVFYINKLYKKNFVFLIKFQLVQKHIKQLISEHG